MSNTVNFPQDFFVVTCSAVLVEEQLGPVGQVLVVNGRVVQRELVVLPSYKQKKINNNFKLAKV